MVDEIIFRTVNPRDRLILELMARGVMRVREVLKLQSEHIEDRKLVLFEPKSRRESEVVFISKKVADRLKEYFRTKGRDPGQRIFPITYPAARAVVKKAGKLVGINVSPHDFRRHVATYASRSRTPIEIVCKIILRRQRF